MGELRGERPQRGNVPWLHNARVRSNRIARLSEAARACLTFLLLATPPTTHHFSLNHGLEPPQSTTSTILSSQRCCWPLFNPFKPFLFPPPARSVSFPINLKCLSISPFLPLASPPPPPLLESTQDLISRFHLLTAYDKFVRPFVSQEHDPHGSQLPTTPAVAPSSDKGKGKERDPGTPTIASAATPGTHNDPDDDEGRDGKKKKNTYRHLIRGIPGD